MRSEVTVTFEGVTQVRMDLHKDEAMTYDAARAWLDQQFIALDCDPLRPTGKVLAVDKVVVVAEAAGAAKFADAQWAQDFARAVSGALGKPVVHIDVPSLSISY
jgi:hypothetical protein